MQIGHSELERGTLKSFKANEVIVREGDYGDCMYIVKSGRVRISKSVMGEDKVLGRSRQWSVLRGTQPHQQ